ncbi:hypothetical protein TSOC_012535 [Tetrabaena socialis]|uniref:Uncharacterized protein n=1 Tax=Tetrabaena socialis TaxID=47790 RepID=A0A2J7ZMT5_9CHLO|nr:hypothetical protein TSOC_012535 [Tetrabaena socialis]|eukprot:PNH01570.1 hypothetical protein TSOC_012535 [Tetrabaena socialis]
MRNARSSKAGSCVLMCKFKVFKPVPSYEVNANGAVRDIITKQPVRLRAQPRGQKHMMVRLKVDGKDRSLAARAVVAYCFLEGAEARLGSEWVRRQVLRHPVRCKSGDVRDLRVGNLEPEPAAEAEPEGHRCGGAGSVP